MSYSFSFRAASAALAVATLSTKLDEVVAAQPIHEADRAQAQAAAEAFISQVDEPAEGQELAVSVSGSIGRWEGKTTNANVSVSVSVLTKTE